MSGLEIVLFVAWALWWGVAIITSVTKGRGMGWGVAAALFPPLYLVLLALKSRPTAPERTRCPGCTLGWIVFDRLPHRCSSCGQVFTHAELQAYMHRDMTTD